MVRVGDGRGLAGHGEEMKPRAGERGRRCVRGGCRCLPWSEKADGVCLGGRNWGPGRRSQCPDEHAWLGLRIYRE
jgi:hypothetical protein